MSIDRDALPVGDQYPVGGGDVIGGCHIRRMAGDILALGCAMVFDTNPYEGGMGYDWWSTSSRARTSSARAPCARSRPQTGIADVLLEMRRPAGRGHPTDPLGAMVSTGHCEIGNEFGTEKPDERLGAVVVEKRSVDPEKETPQQAVAAGAAEFW